MAEVFQHDRMVGAHIDEKGKQCENYTHADRQMP
jgi:hypothetical protein